VKPPGAFDADRSTAVAAAVAFGTIGVLSFIVQPALVQGYVTELGVAESAAVDLVGAEMLGVALSTIAIALIGNRLDWRWMTAAALLAAMIGNLFSAWMVGQHGFAAARFLSGVGHGAIISLSFTFVGLTSKVDRNLAIYLVALLSYGALGLWLMPAALDAVGLNGLFMGWAAACAIAIGMIPFIPRSAAAGTIASPSARQLPNGLLVFALAGVLAFNVAQGIAWAILFLIGVGAGLAEQGVANALFVSQIFAIAGALGALLLAHRVGRWVPVLLGTILGAGCIAILMGTPTAALFLLGVSGFNLLWNFALPFILGAVADFDLDGRMMSPAIAMQMIGLGAGPLIAARLIADGSFRSAEITSICAFILSYALLTIPMLAHRELVAGS